MKKYSLSAIGRDRPGIVAALTTPLYNRGCNIEDSSMTILEAQFAVILIMTMPPGVDQSALGHDIEKVGRDFALTIDMKEIAPEPQRERAALSNYIITLHGVDSTGIVHKTAALLAKMGVNITDLETKAACRVARETGGGTTKESKNLYMMMMEVYVPAEVEIKGLKAGLKKLSEELGLSMSLKPIEDYGRL